MWYLDQSQEASEVEKTNTVLVGTAQRTPKEPESLCLHPCNPSILPFYEVGAFQSLRCNIHHFLHPLLSRKEQACHILFCINALKKLDTLLWNQTIQVEKVTRLILCRLLITVTITTVACKIAERHNVIFAFHLKNDTNGTLPVVWCHPLIWLVNMTFKYTVCMLPWHFMYFIYRLSIELGTFTVLQVSRNLGTEVPSQDRRRSQVKSQIKSYKSKSSHKS